MKNKLGVVIMLLASVFCIVIADINKRSEPVREIPVEGVDSDTAVVQWLEAFVRKDYGACDTYVANSQYALSPYNIKLYMNDTSYYYELLGSLADSMQSLTLVSKEDTGESRRTYTFNVEHKVFKDADSVLLQKSSIKKLINAYINSGEGKDKMQRGISEEAMKAYKKTCFRDSGKLVSSEFKLTEKETSDGIIIYGTDDFINILLENTNAGENIKRFEDEVAIEFGELIGE